jgi:mono/diheme cytochrome c family protein
MASKTSSRVESTLIAFSLLLTGCNSAPRSLTERGAGVFLRACSGCHGPDGSGGLRPGFVVPPRDLRDATYMSLLSDEQIRGIIRNGKGQMPAFGALLEEDEVKSVIAFVRTLPTANGTAR